ncbi:MAG: acyclic terpene utilization AtuA family protein [FCB group bacterium]|jgi:hypothetical protein|nr:acyclic terpene utilization AtuA family protein [FCB group bacterium]
MREPLRIGNAQGFWGDAPDAPARLLSQQPSLDYLTLDYLAEVSLSIMAQQRKRNPEAGYAADFVEVVRSLAPFWRNGSKVRVITNAGGLNPKACAEACALALREAGCEGLRIGVVTGDDVLATLRAQCDGADPELFRNLETGASIRTVLDDLETANAYLGARPVVEALERGADIVVAGRLSDPTLVTAPCIHHFGWAWDDYNRIAAATVAGHIIECGAQVSGGIATRWLDFPDMADVGFPFVEMRADGSCCVTKPEGTGGCVSEETVKEQLLYEIGDPAQYLSPDVCVSLMTTRVQQEGPNRVSVLGVRGSAPPSTYKVSATHRDGFWAQGMLTLFGRDVVKKARRCGEIVLERMRRAGYAPERSQVECIGAGAVVPGVFDEPELLETVLRIGVADPRREVVERFSRELAPLVTAGPQGVTGFSAGRPRVQAVFGYWPCLIEKNEVTPVVEVIEI